jgi:hypothetical protein
VSSTPGPRTSSAELQELLEHAERVPLGVHSRLPLVQMAETALLEVLVHLGGSEPGDQFLGERFVRNVRMRLTLVNVTGLTNHVRPVTFIGRRGQVRAAR